MKIDRSLPCVLLALTLTLPEITLAQATPTNDWIYPRPSHEDKLFVELKNGKTVTGNFYGISDTKLTLSNKNKNRDRKSTRLNSSHQIISYAVFCLKKKINIKREVNRYIKKRNEEHLSINSKRQI